MPAGAVPGAAATLFELVRMIREELGCNTCCGASNISFGLPDRPALNGAFLSMAIGAGMTAAITGDMRWRWKSVSSSPAVLPIEFPRPQGAAETLAHPEHAAEREVEGVVLLAMV